MTKYTITANGIEITYEAESADQALQAYLEDAGYTSIEEAAAVCGQTAEQFMQEISISAAD